MKGTAIFVLALALAPVTSRTNSDAATKRGIRAFEKKEYAAAAAELAQAAKLRPSPQASFNAATAETAAGDSQSAKRDFEAALKDPQLRADALYNRGTGALVRGDFPAAVRDLSAALREKPDQPAAKRNLEIALRRQEQQRRSSGGGQKQGPAGGEKRPTPQASRPAPKPGEADADQILRAVRQQELEELSRMRRPTGERRVGW